MSVWDWIREFHQRAQATGDRPRARLYELLSRAFNYTDIDRAQELQILLEGKALALQLGESWWALVFEHWRLQALMGLNRFREAADVAMQAMLDARKPQNQGCPQGLCIHYDLIVLFSGIDPLGRADKIRDALDYMDQKVSPAMECRFCLFNLRSSFLSALEHYEEAERVVQALLAFADTAQAEGLHDDLTIKHHILRGHLVLCWIAYKQGDWARLEQLAKAGDDLARGTLKLRDKRAEFVAWRALAVSKQSSGDDKERAESGKLLAQAARDVARLGEPPSTAYFEAAAACRETRGEWSQALAIREAELAILKDSGRIYKEAQCRVNICRLLKRLNRSSELAIHLVAAKAVIAQLRDPSKLLAELHADNLA